jgi:hypothetical protein
MKIMTKQPNEPVQVDIVEQMNANTATFRKDRIYKLLSEASKWNAYVDDIRALIPILEEILFLESKIADVRVSGDIDNVINSIKSDEKYEKQVEFIKTKCRWDVDNVICDHGGLCIISDEQEYGYFEEAALESGLRVAHIDNFVYFIKNEKLYL